MRTPKLDVRDQMFFLFEPHRPNIEIRIRIVNKLQILGFSFFSAESGHAFMDVRDQFKKNVYMNRSLWHFALAEI